LLALGQWFSPGTPASSTTKTGRHDIAEILLKVALNTKNHKIKSLYGWTTLKLTYKSC
jgi:proteasome assembly chaperone (PAC2) family protein